MQRLDTTVQTHRLFSPRSQEQTITSRAGIFLYFRKLTTSKNHSDEILNFFLSDRVPSHHAADFLDILCEGEFGKLITIFIRDHTPKCINFITQIDDYRKKILFSVSEKSREQYKNSHDKYCFLLKLLLTPTILHDLQMSNEIPDGMFDYLFSLEQFSELKREFCEKYIDKTPEYATELHERTCDLHASIDTGNRPPDKKIAMASINRLRPIVTLLLPVHQAKKKIEMLEKTNMTEDRYYGTLMDTIVSSFITTHPKIVLALYQARSLESYHRGIKSIIAHIPLFSRSRHYRGGLPFPLIQCAIQLSPDDVLLVNILKNRDRDIFGPSRDHGDSMNSTLTINSNNDVIVFFKNCAIDFFQFKSDHFLDENLALPKHALLPFFIEKIVSDVSQRSQLGSAVEIRKQLQPIIESLLEKGFQQIAQLARQEAGLRRISKLSNAELPEASELNSVIGEASTTLSFADDTSIDQSFAESCDTSIADRERASITSSDDKSITENKSVNDDKSIIENKAIINCNELFATYLLLCPPGPMLLNFMNTLLEIPLSARGSLANECISLYNFYNPMLEKNEQMESKNSSDKEIFLLHYLNRASPVWIKLISFYPEFLIRHYLNFEIIPAKMKSKIVLSHYISRLIRIFIVIDQPDNDVSTFLVYFKLIDNDYFHVFHKSSGITMPNMVSELCKKLTLNPETFFPKENASQLMMRLINCVVGIYKTLEYAAKIDELWVQLQELIFGKNDGLIFNQACLDRLASWLSYFKNELNIKFTEVERSILIRCYGVDSELAQQDNELSRSVRHYVAHSSGQLSNASASVLTTAIDSEKKDVSNQKPLASPSEKEKKEAVNTKKSGLFLHHSHHNEGINKEKKIPSPVMNELNKRLLKLGVKQ
jgi:hypothetical protein